MPVQHFLLTPQQTVPHGEIRWTDIVVNQMITFSLPNKKGMLIRYTKKIVEINHEQDRVCFSHNKGVWWEEVCC